LQLFTFAHKGEAIAFLKSGQYQQIDGPQDLYSHQDHFLLITGEGIEKTLFSLSSVLAKFSQITEVINFGVCASLVLNHKKGSIHSIRTVYAQVRDQIQYKSFESSDPTSSYDILSTNQRILTPKEADRLESFAPLVDRELWAVGYTCHQLKIPWRSYKLISDFPIAEQVEICRVVKDHAEEWSQQLYQHFHKIPSREKEKKEKKLSIELIQLEDHFYFTITQKRILEQYIKVLSKDNHLSEVLSSINLSDIIDSEITPKNRTKKLLEILKYKVNPYMENLKIKLAQYNQPLTKIGTKIVFDQNFENNNIQISHKITDSNSLDLFIKSLRIWNYNSIQSLLNGDFDV